MTLVAHVCIIDGRWLVAIGSINHFAKCRIVITFSGWLYHEIGKSPVEDGIECVDMNLIKATSGLSIRLKESVGIIWISGDIN